METELKQTVVETYLADNENDIDEGDVKEEEEELDGGDEFGPAGDDSGDGGMM